MQNYFSNTILIPSLANCIAIINGHIDHWWWLVRVRRQKSERIDGSLFWPLASKGARRLQIIMIINEVANNQDDHGWLVRLMRVMLNHLAYIQSLLLSRSTGGKKSQGFTSKTFNSYSKCLILLWVQARAGIHIKTSAPGVPQVPHQSHIFHDTFLKNEKYHSSQKSLQGLVESDYTSSASGTDWNKLRDNKNKFGTAWRELKVQQ